MRLPRWLRRKRPTCTDSLEDRIPASEAYARLRAKVEAMPSVPILTEERVREIVREEMGRFVPDLRLVVRPGGTVRVVRPGQTIRRTPGSAGTLKP